MKNNVDRKKCFLKTTDTLKISEFELDVKTVNKFEWKKTHKHELSSGMHPH